MLAAALHWELSNIVAQQAGKCHLSAALGDQAWMWPDASCETSGHPPSAGASKAFSHADSKSARLIPAELPAGYAVELDRGPIIVSYKQFVKHAPFVFSGV